MRLKKDTVEKLGAAAYVVLPHDLYRTWVFKETNLLATPFFGGPRFAEGPFAKEKSMVWATALSDPAGYASALYGVSRKAQFWAENDPHWFIIDRRGTLAHIYRPKFGPYVEDIDHVLEALKKAAR